MGKSTLINALLPDAQAATREIERWTRQAHHHPHRLDNTSNFTDRPGVQAFGLHHLSFGRIEQGFVEFAISRQVLFSRLPSSPGWCALRSAVEAGN
jgi:ribosome biogenesis GTPase